MPWPGGGQAGHGVICEDDRQTNPPVPHPPHPRALPTPTPPMTVWPLSTPAPASGLQAMAALVAGIGSPGFAGAALQALHTAQLGAASWSVYQLRPAQLPCMHLSASLGVVDTTHDCFDAYRSGLYRADRSFDAVPHGSAAVLRLHADELPSRRHREAIYQRHRLVERLSVVQRGTVGGGGPADSLLAINLYRHDHQRRWTDGELAGFAGLAPLLLAAVQRHLALAALAMPDAPAANPAAPRALLQQRCPALTGRELDVCERLLLGWTYDGIAADLGLGVPTVKTYRARAFHRLGLHFKSELFALCLGVGVGGGGGRPLG